MFVNHTDHTDPDFDSAVQAAGLDYVREPIQWYVDKLTKGEAFSLARYGDGELRSILGHAGKTTDGCDFTTAADDLRDTLTHTDPSFLYGLQRVLPSDVPAFKGLRAGPWHDSEVFGRALMAGELWPFIETLRQRDVVVVSNPAVRFIQPVLLYAHYVEVPPCNTFPHIGRVCDALLDYGANRHGVAYLFSCGLSANILVSRLHHALKDNWLLDLGHLWDIFVGRKTREELKTIAAWTVARNLGHTTYA